MSHEPLESVIEEPHHGQRLDVFLAETMEDTSRSFIKKLIKDGLVVVEGEPCTKPGRLMKEGEAVSVTVPEPPPVLPEPEDIPLDVLFEDAHLIIINKPAGLVVHPAPGNYTGTLVNALLFHCKDFERAGADMRRPGIVHRLDRDTSGVMVAAKTQRAFTHLAQQAADHSFDRHYLALVRGEFPEDTGRIVASIGRSLVDRSRMAVTGIHGKEAVTNFTVLERFGAASLVKLVLETGRTHQIRVHMRFAGRPVLGDPTYGATDYRGLHLPDHINAALEGLHGQALHAQMLGITHPETGERMQFSAEPPADFQHALEALRSLKPA